MIGHRIVGLLMAIGVMLLAYYLLDASPVEVLILGFVAEILWETWGDW